METIIDGTFAAKAKLRAMRLPEPARFLLERALEELGDRLAAVDRRFPKAASVYSTDPAVGEALLRSGKVDEVLRVEDARLGLAPDEALPARDEALPLAPGSLDLVVSLHGLHEINDVPGTLVQIRRALKPDGLFLACLAGAGTLGALRESLLAAEAEISGGASPRVLPFIDIREAGALLQRAGFALPVTDVDEAVVRYDDMFALMRDLRAMGATNSLARRSRKSATRRLFVRAAELYAARHADRDGRIRAAFNTIWMSGWAPAESQRRPLAPGSAKMSLADALKAAGRNET